MIRTDWAKLYANKINELWHTFNKLLFSLRFDYVYLRCIFVQVECNAGLYVFTVLQVAEESNCRVQTSDHHLWINQIVAFKVKHSRVHTCVACEDELLMSIVCILPFLYSKHPSIHRMPAVFSCCSQAAKPHRSLRTRIWPCQSRAAIVATKRILFVSWCAAARAAYSGMWLRYLKIERNELVKYARLSNRSVYRQNTHQWPSG